MKWLFNNDADDTLAIIICLDDELFTMDLWVHLCSHDFVHNLYTSFVVCYYWIRSCSKNTATIEGEHENGFFVFTYSDDDEEKSSNKHYLE